MRIENVHGCGSNTDIIRTQQEQYRKSPWFDYFFKGEGRVADKALTHGAVLVSRNTREFDRVGAIAVGGLVLRARQSQRQ